MNLFKLYIHFKYLSKNGIKRSLMKCDFDIALKVWLAFPIPFWRACVWVFTPLVISCPQLMCIAWGSTWWFKSLGLTSSNGDLDWALGFWLQPVTSWHALGIWGEIQRNQNRTKPNQTKTANVRSFILFSFPPIYIYMIHF